METQRIFIAIKINNTDQIRAIFRQVQLDLKDEWVKWVNPKGYHITLGFIGATDSRKIGMIKNRLKACAENINSFNLQLKALGAFPSVNKPRILWIGVNSDDIIYDLRNEIVDQLKHIVDFNDSKFSPHLTIGRIKYGVKNPEMVKTKLENHSKWCDAELLISEFVLMESKSTPQGAIYKVLEKFALKSS